MLSLTAGVNWSRVKLDRRNRNVYVLLTEEYILLRAQKEDKDTY